MHGREHETDADLVDTFGDLPGCDFEIHTGRLQHIGTARLTRARTVAVFGHFDTASGSDKSRGRRYIECAGAVTAGSDYIQDSLIFDIDFIPVNIYRMVININFGGFGPHGSGRTGNLVHGFTL